MYTRRTWRDNTSNYLRWIYSTQFERVTTEIVLSDIYRNESSRVQAECESTLFFTLKISDRVSFLDVVILRAVCCPSFDCYGKLSYIYIYIWSY